MKPNIKVATPTGFMLAALSNVILKDVRGRQFFSIL